MNRLTGDVGLMCNDCGAVFTLRQEYHVNLNPPKFCPQCGTANLVVEGAKVASYLKAKCFSDVDPRLVEMLFSTWAQDAEFRRIYPRFLDYLTNELKYG